MMIRVPGLTDKGMRTTAFTEHIDLFPTLAEMAAGVKLPPCPTGRSQVRVHRLSCHYLQLDLQASFDVS